MLNIIKYFLILVKYTYTDIAYRHIVYGITSIIYWCLIKKTKKELI